MRLQQAQLGLQSRQLGLEKASDNYTEAVDSATLKDDSKEGIEANVSTAYTILEKAQEISIELIKRLQEIQYEG